MRVVKQDKDYNCAVYALHFALGLSGVNVPIEKVEEILKPSSENGTSNDQIRHAIQFFNLSYLSCYDSHISSLDEFLPALINYQYEDEDGKDGHYAVIIGKSEDTKSFIIYNSATGEIELLSYDYLKENWYSERYGKGWFVQIVKHENHAIPDA